MEDGVSNVVFKESETQENWLSQKYQKFVQTEFHA